MCAIQIFNRQDHTLFVSNLEEYLKELQKNRQVLFSISIGHQHHCTAQLPRLLAQLTRLPTQDGWEESHGSGGLTGKQPS
jgi:hypothetical protein